MSKKELRHSAGRIIQPEERLEVAAVIDVCNPPNDWVDVLARVFDSVTLARALRKAEGLEDGVLITAVGYPPEEKETWEAITQEWNATVNGREVQYPDGTLLIRVDEVKPCLICGKPTDMREADSQAAVCSWDCAQEFYARFEDAVAVLRERARRAAAEAFGVASEDVDVDVEVELDD